MNWNSVIGVLFIVGAALLYRMQVKESEFGDEMSFGNDISCPNPGRYVLVLKPTNCTLSAALDKLSMELRRKYRGKYWDRPFYSCELLYAKLCSKRQEPGLLSTILEIYEESALINYGIRVRPLRKAKARISLELIAPDVFLTIEGIQEALTMKSLDVSTRPPPYSITLVDNIHYEDYKSISVLVEKLLDFEDLTWTIVLYEIVEPRFSLSSGFSSRRESEIWKVRGNWTIGDGIET